MGFRNRGERGPGKGSPEGGEVIPLLLSERLEAASQDLRLHAYWELKTVHFTEQPLEEKAVEALEGYPIQEMRTDISRQYHISEVDADTIMRECQRAVREQYNVE